MSEKPSTMDPSQIRTLLRERIFEMTRDKKIPGSVYRIQLNADFTFSQLSQRLDYFKELGIQGLYLSPFLQAVPESPHGYNVANPNKVNQELGGDEAFEEFARQCLEKDLLIIEDIVPNHMGNHHTNPYWMDVLEHGQASRFANYFDITWNSDKQGLMGRVLLPILGDQFGAVLERQELVLFYEQNKFFLHYWDHFFPISPDTYDYILEQKIQDLEEKLGVDHPEVMRLESIITAFRHLPARRDISQESIQERYRESDVTCNRLRNLVEESQEIGDYIKQTLDLFNGDPSQPQSFDLLEELIFRQAYRLSSWRVASEEINYRRFFDINDLVAIRVEDPEVFEAYHRRNFEFLAKGLVHGLRLDHTDGLYDPQGYFDQLQKAYLKIILHQHLEKKQIPETPAVSDIVEEEINTLSPMPRELFVVIEKILERKESLPEDWAVSGTVGYEFLNLLGGLYVFRDSQQVLHDFYQKFTGMKLEYEELLYSQKKKFIRIQMPGEVNMLGTRLKEISSLNRLYRDFTLNSLIKGITEVIACFPVYRTYIAPKTTEPIGRDRHYIHIAVEKARRKNQLLSPSVFDFILDVLTLKLGGLTTDEKMLFQDFVLRFQQISSPIMAKGMEDTTFYIQNRLVSLNEVGGDPEYFGYSPQEFHRQNGERLKYWPHTLLPTSTHDTKRSEDVRMRINTITEAPQAWIKLVQRWSRINQKYKTLIDEELQPDRNTEYLIYQTLIGIWPDYPIEKDYWPVFTQRVWDYFQKAVREAKVFTSWVHVNQEYEDAVEKFIRKMLDPKSNRYFVQSFLEFQKKTGHYGKWNTLSALVLRMGSPGIPDTYRGNELWDYRLVDPDNRGPVDYDLCRHLLGRVKKLESEARPWEDKAKELVENIIDSRIKIFTLHKLLQVRAADPKLFLEGDYLALDVQGPASAHVVAYLRYFYNRWALFVSGRFLMTFYEGSLSWEETTVILPEDCPVQTWKDIFFEDHLVQGQNGHLLVKELFRGLPYFASIGEDLHG